MTISKIRLASNILLIFFVLLMIYANAILIRQQSHNAVELFVYNNLLVAYNVGGEIGMDKELASMMSGDRKPHMRRTVEKAHRDLPAIEDPGKFLNDIVAQRRDSINRISTLRTVAITFILILLTLRAAIFLYLRRKIKMEAGK